LFALINVFIGHNFIFLIITTYTVSYLYLSTASWGLVTNQTEHRYISAYKWVFGRLTIINGQISPFDCRNH